MLKVTWRNLVARKLRLALSGFAIVLGVAFVAGSFIFTDALGGSFDGIIKGTTADAQVYPKGAGGFDDAEDNRTIPASVVDELKQLPEASAVDGGNQVQGVYVIDEDGKVIGGQGAPGFAFNYTETKAITGKQILTLTEGDLPVGPSQVAMDEGTADKAGYDIGDEVTLVTPGEKPQLKAELTGLVKFGSEGGLVGATITIMDRDPMLDLFFDGKDVYSGVAMTAADGVSQQELTDAANAVLPKDFEAKTGDALAKEGEDAIGKALGFINTFLLVFAAVAMVVGTFLIINTFSILVAQRSRELALLRAMGASKRQVNRSVLAEAFAVGLIGSTIGIGVGYLLALGLKALFGAIGLDLAGADFPLKVRTIVVSYLVGLVVTIVAAYLPARRASHIAPVAAMRDDVSIPEASMRRRMVVGGLMILAGIGLMAFGLLGEGSTALLMLGIGMLLILVGVALLSPVIGRPVIHGLGVIFRRMFGTVGTLATENSLRNPRRTAATASALMIGLTLVALMSILGQSAKASTDKAIENSLTSQYVVSNAVGTPFSPRIADEIRQVDGVDTVAQFRQGWPEVDGSQAWLGAVNPDDFRAALTVPMKEGSMSDLRTGMFVVDSSTAKSKDWHVGDRVTFDFQGGPKDLQLAGIYNTSGAIPASYLITLETLEQGGVKPADSLLFITKDPSADSAAVQDAINNITKELPTVSLKNPDEYADEQKAQINLLLYIIYALLGLAVIIAVLGIINTLALSVIERTREVGLLRAVGLSRRQLRRMVRLEAISIAVLGAVLGVVMGVTFGITLQRATAGDGIDVLSVPWVLLLVFVVLSAAVGVLAAVLPARRAAKLNVLNAITTE